MAGWLTETTGERKGQMHLLGEKALSIGRAGENDFVVLSAEASRRHARISWDGKQHQVEDLGSKSGTFVNGRRIAGPTALAEGDEISVPGLKLLYRTSEETMVFSTRPVRGGTLTFLFSDLREFTRYAETHGDAAAARLVEEYRGVVRREIARAEGAEVKTEGDSFLVVFQSARAGLDCAIAVQRELDRISASGAEPINAGIGLHAGETIAQDGNYVGAAVNLAARITAQAGAGEILITDVVRSLLRTSGLPPLSERQGLVLKGVDDPPRVYAVQWRPDPVAAGPGTSEARPK